MDILNTKIKNIKTEKALRVRPENIKSGTTIFGITGTYTSDANATANDIMLGKTAYVNGQKIIGTYVETSINVFVQTSEPETYDGIWIKSDTFEYDDIIEIDNISNVESSSINILTGSEYQTILFSNLTYSFDNIYLTDSNNNIINNIQIYIGDGSNWVDMNGYTELTYIESSGTQYIDTLIKLAPTDRVEMEIAFSGTFNLPISGKTQAFIGAHDGTYDFQMNFGSGSNQSKTIYMWDAKRYASGGSIYAQEITDAILFNKNTFTWVSGQVTYGTITKSIAAKTTTIDRNILIFGYNENGTYLPFSAYHLKLSSLKIYDSQNQLRANFIPVKKDSNNAVCLYDEVTNKFYKNSGTGSFIAGQEV